MDAAENSIDLLPGGKANSVEKMFLDSNEPALPQAAEILRQRFAVRGNDYRDVVVVVPGRRAGRRLLELLIAQTGEGAEVVVPPQIETVGTFAELLYEAKRPFATPLSRTSPRCNSCMTAPALPRCPRPPSTSSRSGSGSLSTRPRRRSITSRKQS